MAWQRIEEGNPKYERAKRLLERTSRLDKMLLDKIGGDDILGDYMMEVVYLIPGRDATGAEWREKWRLVVTKENKDESEDGSPMHDGFEGDLDEVIENVDAEILEELLRDLDRVIKDIGAGELVRVDSHNWEFCGKGYKVKISAIGYDN
ncbi:MAG: hypothetical protein QXO86_01395 [Nitrososphaerota archaeon]